MNRSDYLKGFLFLGGGLVFLILGVGCLHSYSRGAHDFAVFYEAGKLVLEGRGSEIYRVSPDRFLYAPGSAWLFSLLVLFPQKISLGLWNLAKMALIFFSMKEAGAFFRFKNQLLLPLTLLWAMIFVSRPLLIDLEYGQINLMILGVGLLALSGHFDSKVRVWTNGVRWVLLAFVAVAKLFPLPLLLVPWAVTRGVSKEKLRVERLASLLGVVLILLLPSISVGMRGLGELLWEWQRALMDKGLPLESHNQSFTALLYHYLSGHPTWVLAEGRPLIFGGEWLSLQTISFLSLAWSFLTSGILLGWIAAGSCHEPLKWISVTLGLLIVPSHLIWKPYFVFSLPISFFLIGKILSTERYRFFSFLVLLFFGLNLTGFDFVGHHWAAHFEAASLFLLMHLVLLIWASREKALV